MTRQEYVDPERFVAGTVGPPGQRVFFLQAHDGPRTTSAALEKEQVRVLAERLDSMLDMLVRRGGDDTVPMVPAAEDKDAEPLETPVEEDFRVSVLRIAWDSDAQRVLVEAASEPAEDDDELPATCFRSVSAAQSLGRSSHVPSRSWQPDGHPAPSARCRSTRRDTSARGRTVTAADDASGRQPVAWRACRRWPAG